MQAAASRRSSTRTNGVVAGSVWETRMKLDQVKGGIKVFNADDTHDDEAGAGDDEAGLRVYNLRLRRSQNDGAAEKRKRKNWSSPEAGALAVGGGGGDKTPPARLRKTQSSSASNSPKISDKTLVEAGEEKTAVTRSKFWLERVRDAWETCQHKKAVAAAVFTLIWNLSSTVARVWAVFMLVVAVRFYQQRVAAGDEVAEEDVWDGQEEAEPPPQPQQQQQLVQQRHQRWQAAAEDSKQRAGGGVGRGRVAAGGGQAAEQLLGPGRGHRQVTGPSPTKVVGGLVAREKKKWS
ncbi:hypothetical protein Taro_049862 [Colocasia esculenta]|uniref:Uncharacterized protein n=1 Tax=Colocasia esculenta TaxID=4460 RepID=A0A843XC71_COLES|nr:hypothetical protein [Colocasia esculenta]